MISLVELALQSLICTYCGAEPGHACLRRQRAARGMSRRAALEQPVTGRATYLHKARTAPLTAAYWAGHEAAREEQP